MREALGALPRPFDERADPVHVTGSGIVVGRRGVVLHRHKRLGSWLQPGGHVEAGESPAQAALRECEEETGLRLEHHAGKPVLVHVDVHPGPRGHTHLDVRYLLAAGEQDPSPAAGESPDVRWFTWSQARALADDGLRAALAALEPQDPASAGIRPAVPPDVDAVTAVYLRSREAALPDFPWAHGGEDVRGWVARELMPWGGLDVVDVAGVPVAMMVSGHGWVQQLYVDPAWQGRGLGGRLLAAAQQRSPSGLQLWTFVANRRARRFYARHGFREAGGTGGDNEEGMPDVLLVWPGG
jgi:8-oxo-dGTP pyrophosphatase MutT (NUDIX family)/GNAT superfamily N-acetyltransferase